MKKFNGFSPGSFTQLMIPPGFFSDFLPRIGDAAELKLLLFCFWALPQKEGDYPYLRREDFANHSALLDGLAVTAPDDDPQDILDRTLILAVEHGGLLQAEIKVRSKKHTLYFVNTERGRAGQRQIQAGAWQPADLDSPIEILPERPGIYSLFLDNIGTITPMIRDDLKDMEQEYSAQWIEDAIRLAVQNNARSLRYIRAILERWQRDGRDSNESNKDGGKDYVSGRYADFIEH